MGRHTRKLAKKIKASRELQERQRRSLSPFGPPAETTQTDIDGMKVLMIPEHKERMTPEEWMESSEAYRRWMVRYAEQFYEDEEYQQRHRYRLDTWKYRIRCRRCRFPEDRPTEERVLIHPVAVALYETTDDGLLPTVGCYDVALQPDRQTILTRNAERSSPLHGLSGSIVCPDCGFIQPADPDVDVSWFLAVFEATGIEWNTESAAEAVRSCASALKIMRQEEEEKQR